jgi:hypothetical protein
MPSHPQLQTFHHRKQALPQYILLQARPSLFSPRMLSLHPHSHQFRVSRLLMLIIVFNCCPDCPGFRITLTHRPQQNTPWLHGHGEVASCERRALRSLFKFRNKWVGPYQKPCEPHWDTFPVCRSGLCTSKVYTKGFGERAIQFRFPFLASDFVIKFTCPVVHDSSR